MLPSLRILVFGIAVLAAPAARAQMSYDLDQRQGTIGFSVGHFGLFTSSGEFRSFTAALHLTVGQPERTGVVVDIDAGSVAIEPAEARAMLVSPDFLAVEAFPHIVFRSRAVLIDGVDHFRLDGDLTLRGVTRPQSLDVTLGGRHTDPAGRGIIADVVAVGDLPRQTFGMTAEPGFIEDMVRLRILMRIVLPFGPPG